jgi:hypothetical protein
LDILDPAAWLSGLTKWVRYLGLRRLSRIAECLAPHELASACAAALRQSRGAADPGRRLTSARRLVVEAFIIAVGAIAGVWAGWILLWVTEQSW